jgi:hypothetical protein
VGRFKAGNGAAMQRANRDEEQRRTVRLKDLRQSWRSSFDHTTSCRGGLSSATSLFPAREDTRLYTGRLLIEFVVRRYRLPHHEPGSLAGFFSGALV